MCIHSSTAIRSCARGSMGRAGESSLLNEVDPKVCLMRTVMWAMIYSEYDTELN